jgi:hypothetical protein
MQLRKDSEVGVISPVPTSAFVACSGTALAFRPILSQHIILCTAVMHCASNTTEHHVSTNKVRLNRAQT